MDGSRFDDLTRSLATPATRRRFIAGLAAGALGLTGLRGVDAAKCKGSGQVCREDANCCSDTCGSKDRTGRRTCGCPSGTTNCNGTCVNPKSAFLTDPANCGACGSKCPRTKCQVAVCTGGVCGLAPDPKAVGKTCDDGNPGTINDVCQLDGSCKGTPIDCSGAGDQCNDGVYDPAQGKCVKQPKQNGIGCNDGNACTQTDTCQNGVCVGTNPVVCAPLDECHVAGTCDPATGSCSNPDADDGTPCNDGNACTTGDTCQQGVCTGGAATVCDSKSPCIIDSCDPATGCVQTFKDAGVPCADDDHCDGNEVCDGRGTCTEGTPVTCAPPVDTQCQEAGVCDSATGTCSYANKENGTTCTLADQCYRAASCQSGVCTGSNPVVCAASDDCHVAGVCDPATGTCSNPNASDGTPCDDGNLCTTGSTCAAGVCAGGSPKNCDDNNACTLDTCDVTTGQCVNTAINCSDDNPCTTDTCDPVTGCRNTPKYNLAQLDQDDKCHTHTCDSETGNLIQTPVNCDDNNLCTTDTCDPGIGCVHTPKNCNDFNACTTDSCDPATGQCVHTIIDCDDHNACTIDACDPQVGCTYTPMVCDDSNACTKETCDPQIGCVSTPINCDDNNPCTVDTCHHTKGCVNTPVVCNDPPPCHQATGTCNPDTGDCDYVASGDGASCDGGVCYQGSCCTPDCTNKGCGASDGCGGFCQGCPECQMCYENSICLPNDPQTCNGGAGICCSGTCISTCLPSESPCNVLAQPCSPSSCQACCNGWGISPTSTTICT